jgi:hypothetical protein
VACFLITTYAVTAPAEQESGDEKIKRTNAIAEKPAEWISPNEPARVEFNFGDIKAWLRSDGEWHVEGWVEHKGLLCGTYQVGIRFGSGNPLCRDVVWLTEPLYGTHQKQCNNAKMPHNGGDNNPDLIPDFKRVSCAEQLIKCTGTCK